jgi:predicted ATPase
MEMIGQAPHKGATGLLERSRELAALGGSLAEVSDSRRGRMVVIGGEAGIGKTALLRSFCDDLGKAVRVLWASCDPLFTPRPLGPLLDVARVTDGELRAQVERGGTPHDVAAAVMNELASPAPTVLVLEDAHWADEATLDVMRLVSRRVGTVPALFVTTYRDDALDRLHPLRGVLGQLGSGGTTVHLALAGLSRLRWPSWRRGPRSMRISCMSGPSEIRSSSPRCLPAARPPYRRRCAMLSSPVPHR